MLAGQVKTSMERSPGFHAGTRRVALSATAMPYVLHRDLTSKGRFRTLS